MKMYTAAAVARRLDMTERNVRLLRDKGVLTEYKPGLYDLQTATVQYINFLRQKYFLIICMIYGWMQTAGLVMKFLILWKWNYNKNWKLVHYFTSISLLKIL